MKPETQPRRGGNLSISGAAGFTGVFPALFTPLLDDDPKRMNNRIDYAKAKLIIDDLIAEGVSGLVPVGTTGQSPTVSHDQHMDFIRFTAEYVDGRVPLIAGAGSNCTRESVEMIQKIQKALGEMAVLCVTGYYNNPPQEGLVRHYETLSRETGAKIVIYNVPARTSSYLEPETLLHLSRDRNIIGLKQSVDFKSPGRFRDDTFKVIQGADSKDFSVVSGEDDSLHSILGLGGKGIITASGNIPEVARLFVRMVKAGKEGDMALVENLQAEADIFVKHVFVRKNPVPLAALFDSPLYLPLLSVRETRDGETAHAGLMRLIEESAPSLKKYHTRDSG